MPERRQRRDADSLALRSFSPPTSTEREVGDGVRRRWEHHAEAIAGAGDQCFVNQSVISAGETVSHSWPASGSTIFLVSKPSATSSS